MKKYVIAGNRTQARDWIRMDLDRRSAAGETTLSASEYVTVNTVSSLYGVNNVSGVFYGTWKDRSDMYEILQELMYKQSANRPLLKRLHKEWEKHQSNKTSVHNPNISVFVNGVLQHPADYKIVNQNYISFDHPPPKGTDVKVHDGTNVMHHWCDGTCDSFLIGKTIKNTPNGYTIDNVIIDEFSKVDIDEEFRKENSDLIKYMQDYEVMNSGWGKLTASTIESILRLDSWDNEKER